MNDTNVLQINMLGEFSLTYGDKTIDDQSNRSKKLWILLQYLIAFRDREITQNELIEMLWPEGTIDNPANTLKTLLHRVRSVLNELGFTDGKNIILYQHGVYSWNSELSITVDTDQFEQFCRLASATEDENRKLESLLQAIQLYKGDFLPHCAQEFWVVPINAYYHSQYIKITHEALELLSGRGLFNDVIAICQKALVLDSYDEYLHFAMIRALMATGAQRAALQHYEYVTELFFNQFGVTPSPELTAFYREIVRTSKNLELDLNVIKDDLREHDVQNGASFCEYECFKDIYRLEARAASRTGKAIHIALVTITDSRGEPLMQKPLNTAMNRIKDVISSSLRRGDVFTRYSVAQYLIMLPSTSLENGSRVLSRIVSTVRRQYPKMNAAIHYKLLPLDPVL